MSLLEYQPQPTQMGKSGKNNRSDVWIPQLFPQTISYQVECTESYRTQLRLTKSFCLQLGKPVVPASKLAEGCLSSDKARGRMRRCLRSVACPFIPENTGIMNFPSLPAHPKVSLGRRSQSQQTCPQRASTFTSKAVSCTEHSPDTVICP